jgi:tight adherence protein B
MTLTVLILLVGGGFALVLFIVGMVVSTRSERSFVEDRLGRYLAREAVTLTDEGGRPTPLTDWIDLRVGKSTFGEGLASELAQADIKLRIGEYIALMIIASAGLGLIGWLFGGIVMLIVGIGVGFYLPRIYVRRQQGLRIRHFNEQLPDMVNLMVNGLRAGYSTTQAMEAVSKELPSPICDEFRRVVQEMQFGVPMERALDNLLRRVPTEDLDLIITAMNVQREVGGNLAEVLETSSFTIRERIRIKGEIRVLTSQVMISGKFLAVMPILLSVVLFLINRPYMLKFFETQTRMCGIPMLICGGLMITLGYFMMNKIADIEV